MVYLGFFTQMFTRMLSINQTCTITTPTQLMDCEEKRDKVVDFSMNRIV
jgi:hypothetical protein